MSTDMSSHALELAAAGTPVFPCYAATVSPAHKAKAPMTPQGFHDATTDLAQVERWWSQWPGAAIGMPTGLVYDVVDIDKKPNGPDGYVALKLLMALDVIRAADVVKIVKTPSGGRHIYFPTSDTMGNASFRKHGVDLRGHGGYVIVPPSTLYDEQGVAIGSYVLQAERAEGRVLDHERLRAILAPRPTQAALARPTTGTVGGLAQWLREVQEGGRNAALFWAACRAIEGGFDPRDLTDAALSTGLSQFEVDRTIASAEREVSKA